MPGASRYCRAVLVEELIASGVSDCFIQMIEGRVWVEGVPLGVDTALSEKEAQSLRRHLFSRRRPVG